MPKIIGISGISGAGSTTITKALGAVLNATCIFWDEFDEISQSPGDYVEWFNDSGNYADWHYPALEKTLHELKSGRSLKHPASGQELFATSLIIFDGSLGRKHEATARFVDFFIHIDTSMDMALARRLVRDYQQRSRDPIKAILDELQWYLDVGRRLFNASEIREMADFVVNGDGTVDDIMRIIIPVIGRQ